MTLTLKLHYNYRFDDSHSYDDELTEMKKQKYLGHYLNEI
jgi:hypothetical protein